MSSVYGEAGKNTFSVSGVSGILSPTINSETGVVQIFRGSTLNTQQSIGTYNPSTKRFTADSSANLTSAEIRALSSPDGINSIKSSATTATSLALQREGQTSAAAATRANALLSPNSASNSTDSQDAALNQELSTTVTGTREDFRYKGESALRYPANLQTLQQDVMKFSILKYEPRTLNEQGNGGIGSFGDRSAWTSRVKGEVYLPIPSGISDTNAVTWGGGELTSFEKAMADLADAGISGGFSKAAAALEQKTNDAQDQTTAKEIQEGLKAYFTANAVGASNILSRTKGAIQNPNLELLFSGPTLRPFNFSFRLSARSTDDREQIRKIIRLFKQGMAVRRSQSKLFLLAPLTFKIQYLYKGQDHPYINQIKECALQNFTVNYTPDNTYMTFADGLMTSYEIQMTFQELEPIFNDDYYSLDQNNDSVIGY